MENIKTFIKKLKFLFEKNFAVQVFLALAVILIAGAILFEGKQSDDSATLVSSNQNSNDQPADIVFYYGQECSHCKVVEKFIAENKIDERIVLDKKEVWHNIENGNEFQNKAKECALDPKTVGVPFLFARGKCYIGETKVQDFLKKEAAIQ